MTKPFFALLNLSFALIYSEQIVLAGGRNSKPQANGSTPLVSLKQAAANHSTSILNVSIGSSHSIPIEKCGRKQALDLFKEVLPATFPTDLMEEIESYLHLNRHPEDAEITKHYESAMSGDSLAQTCLGWMYDQKNKQAKEINAKE